MNSSINQLSLSSLMNRKEKEWRKTNRFRDLWKTIKHTNICIKSQRKGERERTQRIFEEIITKNFPNVVKYINLHLRTFKEFKELQVEYTQSTPGTSLVVQWVRLHTPNAGGPGPNPGQGTRSCMHAATKKHACGN